MHPIIWKSYSNSFYYVLNSSPLKIFLHPLFCISQFFVQWKIKPLHLSPLLTFLSHLKNWQHLFLKTLIGFINKEIILKFISFVELFLLMIKMRGQTASKKGGYLIWDLWKFKPDKPRAKFYLIRSKAFWKDSQMRFASAIDLFMKGKRERERGIQFRKINADFGATWVFEWNFSLKFWWAIA